MNHTEMPQAERLSEVFDHFNRASARLSASYRFLAEHISTLTTAPDVARGFDDAANDEDAERNAEFLRVVLDALPAGILLLDGDGRVQVSNLAAQEVLGAPLTGRLWRDVITEVFVLGAEVDGLRLANGRVVTVGTGPLGALPGQVVLLNDVTESRVMRALVERRQRLSSLGEMTAALSHQIRTPLASSLLYLSQLERDDVEPAARKRCCAKIRACLGHLDRLSRDMLVFAGGGALNAEDFTVASLLDEFRQLSAALIEEGRCRLTFIDESRGAAMRGNRAAILTVLQNLVENAIQACAAARPGTPGNLRLLMRRVGDATGLDSVEILLTDDGPGIPEEQRARVFEPFYTTRQEGTGLGLAVARAVTQAHGGVIWIESESGIGTTIALRFPAAATDAGQSMISGSEQ